MLRPQLIISPASNLWARFRPCATWWKNWGWPRWSASQRIHRLSLKASLNFSEFSVLVSRIFCKILIIKYCFKKPKKRFLSFSGLAWPENLGADQCALVSEEGKTFARAEMNWSLILLLLLVAASPFFLGLWTPFLIKFVWFSGSFYSFIACESLQSLLMCFVFLCAKCLMILRV